LRKKRGQTNVFKFGFVVFFMDGVKRAYEILEESTGAKATTQHKLTYDSPTETLEPIYFFILDLMGDFGIKVEKLVDNFTSSPGSAHFGEMGQRASVMQQQGSKLMGDINTVLRSVLNLVYDLREYKILLQSYEDLRNKDTKDAALLSLKQRWMDKVDMQKGNSSIKAMAIGQAEFNTLIDAFLVCNTVKDVENLDLNEVVKRILKPRVAEFNHWIEYSEAELLKRYEIEKTYLKSQVESLKLYSSWAKPYLRAAQQLNMAEGRRHPALVKMFNTMLLELTLLGKRQFDPVPAVPWNEEDLGVINIPKTLQKYAGKRNYFEIVLVDFDFRGIPQRTQQGGYVAGGKTEITFRGYALTDEQLQKFYNEFDKSDITDALSMVDGITDESLGQLTEDIDFFLYDKVPKNKPKEEKKKDAPKDQSNPFLALIGAYNEKPEVKKKEEKDKEVKLTTKEKAIEKDYIMKAAGSASAKTTFTLFEIYKKAHGMPAFP
jgi:hypothetical protein